MSDSARPDYDAYFDAVEKMGDDILKDPTPMDDLQNENQKRCKERA